MRNRLLVLAAVVAVGAVAAMGVEWLLRARSFDPDAARERDLVVITCDTTRFDHFHCYGYGRETTPEIDALAADGVRFEQAYAATPITLPSHCTIFTGYDPPKHTVRNNGTYVLPERVVTLAESMAEGGWETAAFISAFVLDRRFNLDQGFQHYDDDLKDGLKENRFVVQTRRADQTVDRALEWVKTRPPGSRVFIWLHFFDPHAPYNPEKPRFGQSPVDRYDAEIFEMDRAIGRFRKEFSALRGRGPVWALLNDHGEGLSQAHGDHNEPAHGIFLYDEILRMPLILAGEGVLPRGVVSQTVARQADVLPTLLELFGRPIPSDLDGRSLLSDLRGPEAREVYLETYLGYEDYGWSPLHGLVKNRWKYVLAPIPELYDLSTDPTELRNLARTEPTRADSMKRALEELLARRAGEPERVVADGASLASLGYTSGSGLRRDGAELPDPKTLMKVDFNIQYKLDEARTLMAVRPLQAFDLLEKIVDLDEANGAALALLGWESIRLAATTPDGPGRERLLEHARRAFRLFAKYAPEKPDGKYGFSKIEQIRGRTESCLDLLLSVVADHPDYLPALSTQLVIYGAERRFDEFYAVAEAMLRIDESHFEARFHRGSAYLNQERYAEAEADFLRLLELRGSHPQVHYSLGEVHRRQGEYAEALAQYEQVKDPRTRTQYGVDAREKECRDKL